VLQEQRQSDGRGNAEVDARDDEEHREQGVEDGQPGANSHNAEVVGGFEEVCNGWRARLLAQAESAPA